MPRDAVTAALRTVYTPDEHRTVTRVRARAEWSYLFLTHRVVGIILSFGQKFILMTRKIIIALAVVAVLLVAGRFIYNRYRVVVPPVDVSRSEIGWSGKSLSGAHAGKVNISQAKLEFQNDQLIGGMFEADMTSLTATDMEDPADNISLADHLKDPDFFDVAKYPKATFTITEVKVSGENSYAVKGVMKIKDVEQPLSFDAQLFEEQEMKRLSAQLTIDRTLFGIKYGAKGEVGSEADWFIYNEFMLQVNVLVQQES